MKLLPMAAGVAAAPTGAHPVAARRLAQGLGDAALALLLWAALLIAWRRLSGSLHGPGDPAMLLAAGVLAAALAGWFRLARGTVQRPLWQRLMLMAAPALALAVLGTALSVAGTRIPALVALWGPMLAEELWAAERMYRRPRRHTTAPSARRPAQVLDSACGMITGSLVEPQPDGEVTQQMIRSRAADGTETLSGWLRVALAPGQRLATAHLAFCPPFAEVPELDVRQTEGPAARVKIGQVLPYGARLELKLAAPAQHPLDVRLRFSARSKANDAKNPSSGD